MMEKRPVLHRFLPANDESPSISDALECWGPRLSAGGRVVALVYAVRFCVFATLVDHRLWRCECVDRASDSATLQPLELDEVYEARVFSRSGELRWLNDPEGRKHRSVFLADEDMVKDDIPSKWVRESFPYIEKIEQTYVVWGKVHSRQETSTQYPEHWTRFSTAQIGVLEVPVCDCDVPRGGRVALVAHEYFNLLENQYGNVGVFEERLFGLRFVEVKKET
jgi:CRISPR-associated protein (TIGR03984 family)